MRLRTLVKRGPSLLRGLMRTRTVGVHIGRGVKLTGPGEYRLHRGSRINPGARIYVGPGATLELHHGARIGGRNVVNVTTGLTLGEGTEVSWDVQIMDTDFHHVHRADGTTRPMSAPVRLGAHVLVGTGSMILKGVTVGDGSVIAAGAVVTRDVPAGVVVAGNPARVVTHITGWK